jgi:putative colanic acid biosynthesis UDP-glucose lipid carrier transferase
MPPALTTPPVIAPVPAKRAAPSTNMALEAGALTLIRLLLPALTSAVLLFGIMQIYGVADTQPEAYRILASAAFLTAFFVFKDSSNPNPYLCQDFLSLVGRAAKRWLIIVGVLALVGFSLKVSAVYSRRVLLTWFVLTPFAVAGAQMALNRLVALRFRAATGARTFVIAGASELSEQLAASIAGHPEHGMRMLGYFDDRSANRLGTVASGRLLGGLADLPAYVQTHGVDIIYIALPIRHELRTRRLLDELQNTTASIYFVPDIFVFDLIQCRVDMINGIPVLALCESPFVGMRALAKRGMDIVVSSMMLLALLPFMLLVALSIKLTTPGSVIFKQRRCGLDGGEIHVYKFRTMTCSDDGPDVPQATADDARITRLGAFLRKHSIDELPQLVNVLQGRMSLVGPRPHAVAHNDMYRGLIKGYMIRHKVPPGITGLAQVNGYRGECKRLEDMKGRIEYDLQYLRTWSMTLDMRILFRTLVRVWHDSRAY